MALILAGTGQLTQRQLESALLSAANALRGPVDPGDYKAYVFPVMFFKWISDNWDYHHAEAVKDFGDNLTDEIEADYHPFAIPDGCHWDDVFETPVNVGSKLATCLQRIQQANPSLAGIFGDVNWANKDRLPESALVALLDTFQGVQLDPDSVTGDMLGAAYEYLLREFAEASGKKAGEFFTPRAVVHLLVKILDPQPGESVADPACGSGGMLVETVMAVRDAGGDPRTLSLHGQEVNLTTAAIAKMNLYLHGLEDFKIVRGDTFREPKLLDGAALQKFDVVIANPPFSLQNWGAETWTKDPYSRVICDVPPAKNGDYAWIQHMVATMTEGTGRVGVVMSNGVLFRGGKEAVIRECLVKRDLLEAVIGLAPNLFYSTAIPVCLLIFRSSKPIDRKGKILFIDASTRIQAGKNQGTLSDDDVNDISTAYRQGSNDNGRHGLGSRMVDIEEVAVNGFDLNIGRYIASEHTSEVNVEVALAAYREARTRLAELDAILESKLKAAGFDA
ncbi:type I restriction-modification system subunit M [Micromonospora carbonacea]|uniref:site-specific DNA-methyltransferase (adenine-specific) n=1 Tax=Micromonospora carbonacea TaxID=47853 RepID=A0A1C4V6I1_9ACTN|nr:class I SAM-dependent DNA methyltransferase [Micromonospora carbonacea]SCE79613.1 type I restriction enzyme M protein [Micromonospora carbonacea]